MQATSTEHHTHIRTQYTYTDTHIHTHTPAQIYICTEQKIHTERTQYAHRHRNRNKQTNIYAAQRTEHRNKQSCREQTQYPDTEQHRTTSTEQNTDYLHKYSYDLYHEQIYINNSNTIELYTILQDKI